MVDVSDGSNDATDHDGVASSSSTLILLELDCACRAVDLLKGLPPDRRDMTLVLKSPDLIRLLEVIAPSARRSLVHVHKWKLMFVADGAVRVGLVSNFRLLRNRDSMRSLSRPPFVHLHLHLLCDHEGRSLAKSGAGHCVRSPRWYDRAG